MWKARSKYVFENFAGNPVEFTVAGNHSGGGMGDSASDCWNKYTSKTSGAFRSGGSGGSIGCCLDREAETSHNAGLGWIIKSAEKSREESRGASFISSSLIAEGLALREAVDACRTLGLKEVRFESDSAQLIKAINGRDSALELYGIVEDIQWMAKDFEIAVFVWISHLRNVVADVLAKNALNVFEQEVVGELIPPPN